MEQLNLRQLALKYRFFFLIFFLVSVVVHSDTTTFDILEANRLNVDNLRLDGNTLSTTNSNGDFTVDLNGTGSTIFNDLSSSTVPYLDASKKFTSSSVTPTELGFISGVTSSLLGKDQSGTFTGKTISGSSNTFSNISVGSLTGTLSISNGGTGQTTQQNAINALTGSQSNGKYLRSDGVDATLTTIQAGDVPTLNQNTTGIASNVSGVVSISNGGTGQTSQQAAINSLTGTQSSGKYLRSDGTDSTLTTIQAGDVPTLNQNTTGTSSNVSGVVSIANGGSGQNTQQLAIDALTGSQSNGKYLRSDGTHSSLTTIQAGDVPTLNQNTSGTSASGTANVLKAGDTMVGALTMNAQNEIRFADADSSNYIAFKGGATIPSNVTLMWPTTAGSNGYLLSTNGSSTLSWVSPGGGGATTALDNLASTAVNADIVPGTDGAITMGSPLKAYARMYVNTISSNTDFNLVTPVSGSGPSKSINIETGTIDGLSDGNTGDITEKTGVSNSDDQDIRSGGFSFSTGNSITDHGTPGDIQTGGFSFSTGSSKNGFSGSIVTQSGNSEYQSGDLIYFTGNGLIANDAWSGQFLFATGSVSGSATSGKIAFATGNSPDGTSGDYTITIGASTVSRGHLGVDGHIHTLGVSPGVSSCGSSPSIVGNDIAGRITVGTGGLATSCTITFNQAWASDPICIVADESTSILLKPAATTGTLVISGALAFGAGDKLVYHCLGYE